MSTFSSNEMPIEITGDDINNYRDLESRAAVHGGGKKLNDLIIETASDVLTIVKQGHYIKVQKIGSDGKIILKYAPLPFDKRVSYWNPEDKLSKHKEHDKIRHLNPCYVNLSCEEAVSLESLTYLHEEVKSAYEGGSQYSFDGEIFLTGLNALKILVDLASFDYRDNEIIGINKNGEPFKVDNIKLRAADFLERIRLSEAKLSEDIMAAFWSLEKL